MSLYSGTKLGPYEIIAPLGAGGMGEVYRARDAKLGRDVAIKILPEAFAHDPERMARFEREAKVLAALNHPNIAAIYAVEDRALVMELVEGETLQGPLPVETALNYTRQIADALEAAHEKGVVHRDLKPANIKVTAQGVVKVLDFGLAAVTQAAGSDPGNSPTLTMSPSHAGMILGTAGYMSPEQARGKPVDKRADIWAFGVVLYEMLTGDQLFHGETVSDTLAAVLKTEPDLTRMPVKVRRLLQRCLEKDPKRRLRDIGDAWALLDEAPPAPPAPARMGRLPWAVAAVLTLALATALWAPWRAKRIEPAPPPLVRLDVDLGSDVSLGSPYGADVILSPDGSRIVYASKSRLFTRRLDQPNAIELAGTGGATAPFFSPDGQWVAFFVAEELKKVNVQGGKAITLCSFSTLAMGGSWGEDGNKLAAIRPNYLFRIPSAGGPPTPVTELAQRGISRRWPQILPGGKAVLFTAFGSLFGINAASIEVLSLGDRRPKTLQRGGMFGRYLPSGHLVYFDHGTLFAQPFDLDRLEVRGAPVPLLDDVAYNTNYGFAQIDFSRNGTVVYRSGGVGGQVTVQWLDSTGQTRPLLAKPGDYLSPRLSPDGDRLAFSSEGDIWVYEWRKENKMRLTSDSGHLIPIWSPDGRFLVFDGKGGIFWTRSDGAAKPQALTQSKNQQIPNSFTADGKRLAFSELDTESGRRSIWTVALESDGTGLRAGKPPEVFLQTAFSARYASFSPDGRWIAYASDDSGTYQVYVRAFPDTAGVVPISTDGGMQSEWSSNHELFFRTPENQIMATAYTVKGDSFLADKPRLWSDKRLANVGAPYYDVAPDGKHIAALMPVETPEGQKAQNHVIFLLNFFDYLRQRVPTGGK